MLNRTLLSLRGPARTVAIATTLLLGTTSLAHAMEGNATLISSPIATLQFGSNNVVVNPPRSSPIQHRSFSPLRTYEALSPRGKALCNLGLFGGLGLLAALRPFDHQRHQRKKRDTAGATSR